jgi:hypothetical protein
MSHASWAIWNRGYLATLSTVVGLLMVPQEASGQG